MQTLRFQAEARQLLRLVIHSVYSDRDVFLRELISNAADALDKLRLETFRDKNLRADVSDLHIEIEVDPVGRTLTVRDNGIGMSNDEIVDVIGTIAKSGTAEFEQSLRNSADPDSGADLIGRFGVGFYASFMVADRVTVLSRRVGEPHGTRWQSMGEDTYTIERVPDAAQGTSVTLELKPAGSDDGLRDYTDPVTVRDVVKRHSDFIVWPIRMRAEGSSGSGGAPSTGDDDEMDALYAEEGEEAVDGGAMVSAARDATAGMETLNSQKALWERDRHSVTDEEYADLYRRLSGDWSAPLLTVPLNLEGRFEFRALLFVPVQAPYDLYSAEQRRRIQLYVRHVLVTEDGAALVPEYLRFVHGVVDAQDLALTMSRENLQRDQRVGLIRRQLTKNVLSALEDFRANDDEQYGTFWTQFGAVLKEGLISDASNRSAILRLSRFATTAADDLTTLEEYVRRMADNQGHIYYLSGAPASVLRESPHLEALSAKNVEVLLLGDPVDEIWLETDPTFADLPFRSAARDEIDLDGDGTDGDALRGDSKDTGADQNSGADGDDAARRDDETAAGRHGDRRHDPLLAWMSGVLREKVTQVRLSSRLTTSPACLVTEMGDLGAGLDPVYRHALRSMSTTRRILEINPRHPLIEQLERMHATHPAVHAAAQGATYTGDPDITDLTQTAEVLYGMAVLAEGGELENPGQFVRTLADRLGRAGEPASTATRSESQEGAPDRPARHRRPRVAEGHPL